jgi:hypothetical protein
LFAHYRESYRANREPVRSFWPLKMACKVSCSPRRQAKNLFIPPCYLGAKRVVFPRTAHRSRDSMSLEPSQSQMDFESTLYSILAQTGKLHVLAALRLLQDQMRGYERERRQRIGRGDEPAEADRDAAQLALTAVVAFFLDYGIESEPLVRLLSALAALSEGSRPSSMLTPAAKSHRRPTPPAVEGIKGRLAAIMEFQQLIGMSRKDAARWVVTHMPAEMRSLLGSIVPSTVDSWLTKWGGDRGATSGSGREGYLSMRSLLASRSFSEHELKSVLDVLERSLPS